MVSMEHTNESCNGYYHRYIYSIVIIFYHFVFYCNYKASFPPIKDISGHMVGSGEFLGGTLTLTILEYYT